MSIAEFSQAEKSLQAKAIASALGSAWSFSEPADTHYGREIRHADGHAIWLRWRDDDRLELSGRWPRTRDGRVSIPRNASATITVSVSKKSPNQIARDITKRLLPDYLRLYAEQVEQVRQNDQYEQSTKDTASAIATAIGAKVSAHHTDQIYPSNSYAYRVTANGTKVDFDVRSCPRDVAIKVLALLREGA